MPPLLQINGLSIDFVTENGITHAVKDITFTINRNEIVGIAGESGSGKSVTALAMLQLLPAATTKYASGEMLFSPDGRQQRNIIGMDSTLLRAYRGKEVGMIFQEPMTSLNPVFTCGQQVMEAIRLHQNVSREFAAERTIELFRKVKLPDPEKIIERYPHELSGGQKQRVMIAMAMSGDPSLLICDEPTTALDVTVQKTVLQLIRELQRETKMGVIFITHDLSVISEIADRVIIMYRGGIVEQGGVEEVFTHPRHRYTKALLACRPALYRKGEKLPVVGDFLHTAVHTTGSETPTGPQQQPRLSDPEAKESTKETLISVRDVTVTYPTRRSFFGAPLAFINAVDGVTFDVLKGETLGLVGESGCGKSTLGRALLRLIEPDSGEIHFEGTDLRKLDRLHLRRFRKNVQIIFQDPFSSLNPSITIGKAIEEPVRVHFPQLSGGERKQKVIDLLEKVGLGAAHLNRYPHEFSGGQRQRIVIARALAVDPRFIVCDESVSALDVSVQAQVLNLLNDLKQEFGFTSVFISHDLSVVRYMCDRIMVMHKGRIVESGTASDIYSQPQSPHTRRLLEAIPRVRFAG